ncbi:hypothetical protein [Salinimicrobium terrae]|uniref:hypothetical protein n=1 Tax=Salinimicrobium terrae TaxID=470866 RepID=UPI000422A7CE|nr:hypothetical protein [Salinimicrobium terrae]
MGRPATKPKDLKDGYYIEVRNKNQKSGVKIRRDTIDQLQMAIDEYKENKEVVILGKQENGEMKDIPEFGVEL